MTDCLTQGGHDEYQYVAHGAAGRAAFGNNDFRRGPVNVDVIRLKLKIELNDPEPHLNMRPTPAWIPTFSLGALLSMMLLHTTSHQSASEETQFGVEVFTSIAWDSLLAAFFFTILVSMWVAFRGSGRQFVHSMHVRLFLIGLIATPVSLLLMAYLLDAIAYGTPTLASPGLEIQLGSAILTGEAVVRITSKTISPMLNNVG